MNKTYLKILVTVLVVAIALTTYNYWQFKTAHKDWNTYANTAYGFELQYPPSISPSFPKVDQTSKYIDIQFAIPTAKLTVSVGTSDCGAYRSSMSLPLEKPSIVANANSKTRLIKMYAAEANTVCYYLREESLSSTTAPVVELDEIVKTFKIHNVGKF